MRSDRSAAGTSVLDASVARVKSTASRQLCETRSELKDGEASGGTGSRY